MKTLYPTFNELKLNGFLTDKNGVFRNKNISYYGNWWEDNGKRIETESWEGIMKLVK